MATSNNAQLKKGSNKIIILLPNNHQYFDNNFTMNLVDVVRDFYEWVIKSRREDTLSVIMQGGLCLDEMRNHLTYSALSNNQTHLLYLDTDMTFPRFLVQRMMQDLEDNPTVEAITGLYHWKKPPFLPQLYTNYSKKTKKWRMVAAFPDNALFPVQAAGAGCLMVKASVFSRIKQPYFKFGYKYVDGKSSLTIGEEMYFFKKARPLLLCDPTLVCNHYYQNSCNLSDYLSFNNIEVKNNNLILDKKQLSKIIQLHKK